MLLLDTNGLTDPKRMTTCIIYPVYPVIPPSRSLPSGRIHLLQLAFGIVQLLTSIGQLLMSGPFQPGVGVIQKLFVRLDVFSSRRVELSTLPHQFFG